MKCLRCGKEMENETECSCGHFYDDNLNSNYEPKRDKYGNKIEKNKNVRFIIKQEDILGLLLFIFFLGALFLFPIFAVCDYLKAVSNPVKGVPSESYCNFLCENNEFKIDGDYCICSDGREYSFH